MRELHVLGFPARTAPGAPIKTTPTAMEASRRGPISTEDLPYPPIKRRTPNPKVDTGVIRVTGLIFGPAMNPRGGKGVSPDGGQSAMKKGREEDYNRTAKKLDAKHGTQTVRKNTRVFPGFYQPGRKVNLAGLSAGSTVQVQCSTVLPSVLQSPSREKNFKKRHLEGAPCLWFSC